MATDESKFESWQKFYNEHHQFLKVGAIRDNANRIRLMKVLRFYSAKSPEKWIGLDDYVKTMKKDQKEIYFLGGENKESILKSPHIERLVKRGYDVLFFTEPVDEYFVQQIPKYEEHKFVDVSKEGLKLSESDADKLKDRKEEFRPLTEYLEKVLTETVQNVEVSARLTSSPCALVSASWGYSANMERIASSQPMADKSQQFQMKAKKTLEINPKHPIMIQLLATVNAEQQNEATENMARLLLDSASIASGYSIKDTAAVASRLCRIIAQTLSVDPNALPEEDIEEEVKEEENKHEVDMTPREIEKEIKEKEEF